MRAAMLVLLAGLSLVLAVQTGDKKPADKPVKVPFELLKSGHMAVEVKVNGKGPYLLIFDTGAPLSILNTRLAKEAGLLEGKSVTTLGPFSTAGDVKIKSLEVGTQKATDVPAMIMDHPTVDALGQALGKRLYGLVGFPFFARFRMTIDYETKTLTLVPSGYRPPDIMRAMTASMLGGNTKRALAPAAQWGILASKEVGDEEAGFDVSSVVPGSAADKGGIRRGDRLLTLDGRWTDSIRDLYDAASQVKAGTKVTVRVKRAGKEIDVEVTPVAGL